jgi:putative membrane protein
MSAIHFNPNELEQIKQAVKDAESKTSGEIATAFIKESDDYAVYELLFALFCGFIYFFAITFFAEAIEPVIRQMSWDYTSQHLLAFFGFSTFLVIGIFYLLANLSFIDRLVVPRSVMRRKVSQRAVRQFMESGVYNTKDRTGILIFISQLEHRVELLADSGINEKVPQEKWDSIVQHIIKGIKNKQVASHLSEAIRQCGELLQQHFPIQEDDVNELKDDIAILEK